MLLENLVLYGVPAGSFAATVFLSFYLAKLRSLIGLCALNVLWIGFTAAMLFGLDQANSWDGLVFMAALLGISAPVGVGSMIGCTFGLVKRNDTIHA